MMRSTMNISLPPALRQWVEHQVEARGFSTASEFVRDMIRREREQSTRAQVDRRLLDASRTPLTEMTESDWDDIARQGRKRAIKHKKK
jgi:antitoxin ParD1/3/4